MVVAAIQPVPPKSRPRARAPGGWCPSPVENEHALVEKIEVRMRHTGKASGSGEGADPRRLKPPPRAPLGPDSGSDERQDRQVEDQLDSAANCSL